MKILRRELIAILVALVLLAGSSASTSQAEQFDYKLEAASHHEGPDSRKLRVLFIGNSYAYVNNLARCQVPGVYPRTRHLAPDL